MKIIYDYLLLFSLGALGGWIGELFYRRIFSAKKWINPGFLTGPCLPLYGFGVAILYFICSINYSYITDSKALQIIMNLFLIGILMTLIEYIAGIIFIRHMKIRLWDYSKRWGNIQGIICPLFSLIWLGAGALYLFFVQPQADSILSWFNKHLDFSFFLGLFYGIFIIDLCISFNLSYKIKAFAKEKQIVVSWEQLKLHFGEKRQAIKEHTSFVLPFKVRKISFKDVLQSYADKLSELKQKREEKKELNNIENK